MTSSPVASTQTSVSPPQRWIVSTPCATAHSRASSVNAENPGLATISARSAETPERSSASSVSGAPSGIPRYSFHRQMGEPWRLPKRLAMTRSKAPAMPRIRSKTPAVAASSKPFCTSTASRQLGARASFESDTRPGLNHRDPRFPAQPDSWPQDRRRHRSLQGAALRATLARFRIALFPRSGASRFAMLSALRSSPDARGARSAPARDTRPRRAAAPA